MPSNEWLLITVGAVLVNNIVLSRILGICPFLGVSKKIKTALGMAGAVIFVMGIASFATSVLYHLMLSAKINIRIGSFQIQNLDIAFTKILVFIVVIAGLVQIVEILLQKFSPALYGALGIYLPLITTNCAVLGAAELNAASGRHSRFDRLRHLLRHRFRACPDPVCKHSRTSGAFPHPEDVSGDGDCADHCRNPGAGVHGIFRSGQINLKRWCLWKVYWLPSVRLP